jgi:succinate-semialdehyde dehydrogenase/glutarate-semialdehyde dehydrogenase
VGPVAAFTPWNFPINQVVRKLSARSPPAARSSSRRRRKRRHRQAELIRAFADAGVPAGVINLVYGNPPRFRST